MVKEHLINSLLCFIKSSVNDYSHETIKSIIYSFYSLEEIKNAKDILSKLLNRNQTERRDPHKKRKELDDLVGLFEEYNDICI